MHPDRQSIAKHKFFTSLSPAYRIKIRTVPRQKFSKQLLDAMYHESLPGLIRSWRASEYVEVGLINVAVPLTRHWKRGELCGLQLCLTPEEIRFFDLIAFAAMSDLGTHKALVPRDVMLKHGTLILSPFHKYFTHYPLEMQVIRELMEQRLREKNLEFRRLLEMQRR